MLVSPACCSPSAEVRKCSLGTVFRIYSYSRPAVRSQVYHFLSLTLYISTVHSRVQGAFLSIIAFDPEEVHWTDTYNLGLEFWS